MKKTNFKLFLTATFILVGVFSLIFISNTKVSAQAVAVKDTIKVETTGYSILGESSFVFGGYYSGNFDKKGFTTYFEFKKNDANLDIGAEKTIVIQRFPDADEYNDFYTSPELDLFSDYYFRAVGCFEKTSDKDKDCSKDGSIKKYYGETLSLRTGYIPIGMTYPFTTVGNNNVPIAMKFISANILVDNITENSADFKTTIYNKNFQDFDFKIEYGENNFDFESDLLQFNSLGKSIITIDNLKPKTTYKYRLYDTANKLTPTATQTFTTKSVTPTPTPPPPTPEKSPSGLVKCGLSDANGKVENPCGFYDILTLINTVVHFVIFDLVLPIAALMFAYAGFELITSGGETSKREKAKSIFTNVALGLVIVLAAFLIIQTILSIVGYDKSWDWFGF
ncbi:MAG: pilin [Candidatus Nomurabacteria bacterium]|nr:pilin [Candidatus Nomurabacteria bacterium]